MRIPNLLEHDNLEEATSQAMQWNPLLGILCLPDTQVFLCSLFSPICLERVVYPCKSLCEGVQRGCEGYMKRYGFPWPEMFRCDKFPDDNDLCIPGRSSTTAIRKLCVKTWRLFHRNQVGCYKVIQFWIVAGRSDATLSKKTCFFCAAKILGTIKIFLTAILLSDFLITIIQDLTSSKSTFIGEIRWSDIRVRVNKWIWHVVSHGWFKWCTRLWHHKFFPS